MGRMASIKTAAIDSEGVEEAGGKASGSQTLLRGLDVIDALIDGSLPLAELSEKLDLTRSTTHRLASALVERRLLSFRPREGYSLGPKLLELGHAASQQMHLPRVARPHLEQLSAATEDTAGIIALTSSGFTVGTSAGANAAAVPYVYMAFAAGSFNAPWTRSQV